MSQQSVCDNDAVSVIHYGMRPQSPFSFEIMQFSRGTRTKHVVHQPYWKPKDCLTTALKQSKRAWIGTSVNGFQTVFKRLVSFCCLADLQIKGSRYFVACVVHGCSGRDMPHSRYSSLNGWRNRQTTLKHGVAFNQTSFRQINLHKAAH